MAKIGDNARVTMRAFQTQEEIRLDAYRVWAAARSATVNRGSSLLPHTESGCGRLGRLYHGSMTELIRRTLPGAYLLRGEARTNHDKALTGVMRGGGNAFCVSGQTRDQPVIWWIADEWSQLNDNRELSIRDKAEDRITPDEAGETRPAAPVIVRMTQNTEKKETPVAGFKPKPGMGDDELARQNPAFVAGRAKRVEQQREEYRQEVINAIAAATRPMTLRDVATAMGKNPNSSNNSIRDHLNALVAEGLVEDLPRSHPKATRYFVPAGATFDRTVPPALTIVPDPPPSPEAKPTKFRASTVRAVIAAARAKTGPVTTTDLSVATGYEKSTIGKVINERPDVFKELGRRGHHKIYSVQGQITWETPIPPPLPRGGERTTATNGANAFTLSTPQTASDRVRAELAQVEAQLASLVDLQARREMLISTLATLEDLGL